jgi:periplasmic protein TonB
MLSAKTYSLAATTEITVAVRVPPVTLPSETVNYSGARWARGPASPSCFYMPNPAYTDEAKAAKFEGLILVGAVVQADGSVGNLQILKSPGLGMNEQVLKTMSVWKCIPAIENGIPLSTKVQFEINFHLN